MNNDQTPMNDERREASSKFRPMAGIPWQPGLSIANPDLIRQCSISSCFTATFERAIHYGPTSKVRREEQR